VGGVIAQTRAACTCDDLSLDDFEQYEPNLIQRRA
jgi:hypothetical protein